MSQCFVGGVHYDIGMKDIREAFAPFGVIKTVDLNVDPLTGRHKVSVGYYLACNKIYHYFTWTPSNDMFRVMLTSNMIYPRVLNWQSNRCKTQNF